MQIIHFLQHIKGFHYSNQIDKRLHNALRLSEQNINFHSASLNEACDWSTSPCLCSSWSMHWSPTDFWKIQPKYLMRYYYSDSTAHVVFYAANLVVQKAQCYILTQKNIPVTSQKISVTHVQLYEWVAHSKSYCNLKIVLWGMRTALSCHHF